MTSPRQGADLRETATCTVTIWNPPHELRVVWDYTGEGPSELSFRLAEVEGQTRITLAHTRSPADPVQYGAGWHVHLDSLANHVSGGDRTANGCDDEDFLAAYRALEPRYAAVATG
ncbi:MAG: SRPBCC domain-containing protein [Pseudonocardiaceae bacterium]